MWTKRDRRNFVTRNICFSSSCLLCVVLIGGSCSHHKSIVPSIPAPAPVPPPHAPPLLPPSSAQSLGPPVSSLPPHTPVQSVPSATMPKPPQSDSNAAQFYPSGAHKSVFQAAWQVGSTPPMDSEIVFDSPHLQLQVYQNLPHLQYHHQYHP